MGTTNDSDHPDIETRLDRLETVVDRLWGLLEEQRAIIERQQNRLDDQGEDSGSRFSRRSLLHAAGVVGLAGYGTRKATADPQGEIGTDTDPVQRLYTEELNGGLTGDQAVTNLLGAGLSIDSETLSAADAINWEDSNDNNLLEVNGSATGIEATDVNTDNLTDNGSGQISLGSRLDLDGNDIADTRTTIWDQANGYIPQGRLENDSVTVSAGTGLTNGGSVSLGSSTTLDIASGGVSTAELASQAVTPSEIDGSGGTTNQVLTTDGNASGVSWANSSGAWTDSNGNGLLEPTSTKGLEVNQLSSDPDITDNMGGLYVSDGSATGSAGDVVIGADNSGADTRAILFDHANSGIPGGSLTTGSVTDTELNLSITPTWTGIHTFDNELETQEVSTPGNASSGYNKLYFKSDGNLYKLDSDGNENQVGSGGGTVEWQKNVLTTDTSSQSTLRNDLDFGNLTQDNTYRFSFFLRFSQSDSADDKQIYWTCGGTSIIDFIEEEEVDDEVDAAHGSVIFTADGTSVTINVPTLTDNLQSNSTSNTPGTFTILESLSNHNEVTSF